MNRISLKYRIAITVFLLEAVMVSLVLWQTQSASFETIHRQTERSEHTILNLMAYEARYTLINGEYADFQVFAEQTISDSSVLSVLLADYNNRIVVSTSREMFGKILPEMSTDSDHEWHSHNISNESGYLGRLVIGFSREELNTAYDKGIRRGVTTAAVSMGIIALVGIMIGFLLTRRLENLQKATRRMADGDLMVRVSIQGKDELSSLGRNFNTMATKLHNEMEGLDSRVHERTKDLNSANRKLAEEVNKHKETNRALMESKAMFKAAMDYSQAGIAIARAPDGQLIYVNDSALNIRGEAKEKIVDGIGIDKYVASWQILHFDGTPYKVDEVPLARAIMFGDTCSEEFIVRRPDQEDRIVWANAAPIKNEKDEIIYGIVVFLDITKRKKAELENSINRIRLDISNEIITMPDASEKKMFAYVLERMLELSNSKLGFLGYISPNEQEMEIHNWSNTAMAECSIHDKPIKFPIAQAGIWGEPVRNRKPIISNNFNAPHPFKKGYPDGHVHISRFMSVPVFDGDKIFAIAAVANSPSPYSEIDTEQLTLLMMSVWEQVQHFRFKQEKENLQAQIRQAQRVESIGNLAGGIAHDFNNILFPIIGMSELLLEDLPSNSLERENAEEIYKAGKRGKDLVQQILAFSRQADQEKMPIRIQSVLKEVLKLIKSTIPSYIEINQDIQVDCGLVMADPTQIHQVAMNLITNSFHAVEANGGEISITLKETILDSGSLSDNKLESEKNIVLSVSDTGHGMSQGIQEKIFDPYFTTKEKGKGTGLGLAVVHGIISEHGGTIEVSSEIGKGTVFHIYLPLMDQTIDSQPIDKKEMLPIGNERILLVDDEEPIAKLEKQILERLGYQVKYRINAVEALEVFGANPSSFDLVITDMAMPNMTGDQLAYEIRHIRPDLPIIVCTGFSERVNKNRAEDIGVNGILMKPIIRSEMVQMIRRVLDEAKSKFHE